MPKSLLYQDGSSTQIPPGCIHGMRTEVPVSIRKDGRVYRFMLRDTVVPEDATSMMMKAAVFSIAQGEPYSATPVSRAVRDVLIKQNTVV
jgi:hypothetical protein